MPIFFKISQLLGRRYLFILAFPFLLFLFFLLKIQSSNKLLIFHCETSQQQTNENKTRHVSILADYESPGRKMTERVRVFKKKSKNFYKNTVLKCFEICIAMNRVAIFKCRLFRKLFFEQKNLITKTLDV